MKEKGHLSYITLFTLLLVSVFGSGCATIIHGTTQNIPVSSVPTGAKVTVDQSTAYTTPTVLELARGENHNLQVSLEGYHTEAMTLQSVTSGAVMGNLIAGGLIGWGVDAASGAQYRLVPESLHITLRPIKAPFLPVKSTPTRVPSIETISSPQPKIVPASTAKPVDSNAMTLKIEKQLELLRELRQKHLITEEDYQKAKKNVLRKLTE